MEMINLCGNRIELKQLHQVGLVVNDAKAVAGNYWRLLGIGPHTMFKIEPIPGYAMTYRGAPAKYRFIASFCQVGPVEIEFLQSLEGPTIYTDHIREHGEGPNHLQFLVDEVGQVKSFRDAMTQKGFAVLMDGHYEDVVGYAYMDTFDSLKTIWEAVKIPAGPFGTPPAIFPSENEPRPSKIEVERIAGVGLVVKDLESVMKNYRDIFNIVNWEVSDFKSPTTGEVVCNGRVINSEWKTAATSLGDVVLELVQPLSGDNIFSDFLGNHGEGIHHVRFKVDDIEETNRIMEVEGIEVLMGGRHEGSRFAFYDTQENLKVIWAAFQGPG